MDRLKAINDSLEHLAGDLAIKETAARISAECRETDTAARFGGDEFAVLLTGVDHAAKANVFVGRMMRSLLSARPEWDGAPLALSASAGIAIYPGDGNTIDAIIASADRAMYGSKRAQLGAALDPVGA
jgi:diguanylate cyclase (GGDEF)-like protein